MMNTQNYSSRFGFIVLLVFCTLICPWQSFAKPANPPKSTTEAFLTAYNQDLMAFKRLRTNVFGLVEQIRARSDLFGAKPAHDTALLRPEIREQIIAIWYPFLDNYLMMDTIGHRYSDFYQQETQADRKRAFHLAHAVFLAQYRCALDAIVEMERNPVVATILNETVPPLGLPDGVYAHFKFTYLNLLKASRYVALESVANAFGAPMDKELKQWTGDDSRTILAAGVGPGPLMTMENGLDMLQRFGHAAWFPVQKSVAEWMGQTKVWRPQRYLITHRQIQSLSQRLEPGDILLERREWYLTNVGIPGFWTHAALYIGGQAQRDAMSRHPQVKDWLREQGAESLDALIKQLYPEAYSEMQTQLADGNMPQVIEALSPGVGFTSLKYSATCDSIAILRPRLSAAARAAAVVRAMRYYGRPYDYDFDFGSDRSLVCTELIVKSYLSGRGAKGLNLPLQRLMGHMVTPANAFVRQFDETYGTADQQTDMVVFLDGNEKEQRAVSAGSDVFRSTWKRPKWHIWIQKTQASD